MGWMPCLVCGQRFAGEARNAYLQVYEGDSSASFRFVGCPSCLEGLLELWLVSALRRDADGEWQLPDGASPLEALLRPLERPAGRGKGRK